MDKDFTPQTCGEAETKLYKQIASQSPVGIIVSDAQTHEIYYTNRSFRELMKLEREQRPGELCYKYVRGLSSPCEHCAALELKAGECSDKVSYFPWNGTYVNTKSVLVDWLGKPALMEYNTDITDDYVKRAQEKDLLDRVPNGIGIYDIDHGTLTLRYLNDGFYRMTGRTRNANAELTADDIWKYVYPDDILPLRTIVSELEDGEEHAAYCYRLMCGDGKYHWLSLAASVARREMGITTVYCSYTDNDETAKARAELEKANEELRVQYGREKSRRELMEKDCIAADCYNVTKDQMLGSTAGAVTNSTAVNYNMKSTMELILKRIPMPEDAEKLKDFFERDRLLSRFAQGRTEDSIEYRSLQKDGRLEWRRASLHMVKDTETDDLVSYTYIYDIDREKKRQLALACVVGEEIEYVLLVNIADGTAEVVNRDKGQKLPVNVRLPFEQIPQSPDFDRVVVKDASGVAEFYNINCLKRELQTRPVVTNTFRCELPDGSLARKKERAFYLDDSREDIVVARRDITDLFEEEQRQKAVLQTALDAANDANEAKSEFLSRMSHDIRTPMNGIIGIARLVRECDGKEERDRYLSELDASGRYLLGLVNDILTMSKISEGKIELKPEAVKTDEYISQIARMASIQAEEKGLCFEARSDGGPEVKYQYFDPLRVQQILMNLLSNAIKYTPKGGRVSYSYSHTEKDGKMWGRHVISDDGVGISPEFVKVMFNPFTQEANTQSHLSMGTGLGLAICKKLCDLMGGEITAESTLGVGSTFTVEIPTVPLDETEYRRYTEIPNADGQSDGA